MMSRVYYLCDRKACDRCSNYCKHTSDITHAVNFEVSGLGDYLEIKRQEQERIPIDWIKQNIPFQNEEDGNILLSMIDVWRKEND